MNRSWTDDPGDGGARSGLSGDWRSEQPRFDNPMSWSLPLAHVAGVSVRIHLLFLVIAVTYLLKSMLAEPGSGAATPFDLPHTAVAIVALFWIVLLHEFGHVIACRRVGGDADEILIWPLGGLAACDPPMTSRALLATALGGPAVNVLIGLATGAAIWLAVGWEPTALFPNPLRPLGFTVMSGRVMEVVFIVHWMNWVLLLVNLLPIFPLDGGQAVRALLTRSMSPAEATRHSARIGFVAAILVIVASLVVESLALGAIALFGGITCFVTLRRLDEGDAILESPRDGDARQERLAAEREARRRAALAAEQRLVDAILEKIARQGRGSLTWGERRLLRRATRRLREE